MPSFKKMNNALMKRHLSYTAVIYKLIYLGFTWQKVKQIFKVPGPLVESFPEVLSKLSFLFECTMHPGETLLNSHPVKPARIMFIHSYVRYLRYPDIFHASTLTLFQVPPFVKSDIQSVEFLTRCPVLMFYVLRISTEKKHA